jgi:putative ABC transport system permease protein
MFDLALSLRTLRARPLQALIPSLIVGLAVALSVAVFALGDGVRQGIIRASDPFGVLVVGAKGDAQQLVLNTLLLQGLPVGNIPSAVFERLRGDPRVRLAVPLATGDNLGGAPIIGTDATFFELRTRVNAPPAFQIAQGALFDADFEAVLGSVAAAQLGLNVGDTFRGSHGLGAALASDLHEEAYTVVGILAPSSTPFDRAVFTTVNTVWEVHANMETQNATFAAGEVGTVDNVTAILVAPVGFVEQNQLWQEFYVGTEAQAAFPGQELAGLFDLLSQGERILSIVGYLVLGIAALTVFLAMYNLTLNRQQEIAIIRSMGGSRASVFRMIITETLIITLLGALVGRVIGYVAAFVIGAALTNNSAIPIPIRFLPALEPLLWALPVIVGIAAGLLPAIRAYQVDVIENLFPT